MEDAFTFMCEDLDRSLGQLLERWSHWQAAQAAVQHDQLPETPPPFWELARELTMARRSLTHATHLCNNNDFGFGDTNALDALDLSEVHQNDAEKAKGSKT